jgi:membrane AbrB-like protein
VSLRDDLTSWQTWGRGLAGLAIGIAAGWLCARIGTPIPWMLGPLFALAVLRVAGFGVTAPPGARYGGQWIIGTSLGLYFTPQVMHEVVGWWPLLAAGAAFAIALGYGAGLLLARLAGIDRTTAVFASVPGGAAEMAVLGERFGARTDKVAAAQSLRILLVVGIVPAAYALLGVHGSDAYVPGTTIFAPKGFAMLMAATFVGSAIAQRLNVPNAFVLGSLAVAIPLTVAQVDLSAVPRGVSNAGQCLLGCALGARFQPDFLRGAPRFVLSVTASVVAAIGATAAFGWALARLSGLPAPTLILGLAPGGIAEMAVTAKVLQLGVPMVTTFHVTRLVVLLLLTAPLFTRLRAWRRAHWGEE